MNLLINFGIKNQGSGTLQTRTRQGTTNSFCNWSQVRSGFWATNSMPYYFWEGWGGPCTTNGALITVGPEEFVGYQHCTLAHSYAWYGEASTWDGSNWTPQGGCGLSFMICNHPSLECHSFQSFNGSGWRRSFNAYIASIGSTCSWSSWSSWTNTTSCSTSYPSCFSGAVQRECQEI
jgi:hypothetical protein